MVKSDAVGRRPCGRWNRVQQLPLASLRDDHATRQSFNEGTVVYWMYTSGYRW